MTAVVTPPAAALAVAEPPRRRPYGSLFAHQRPGRVTRAEAVLAALAVLGGTALQLVRVAGPGALNSVWAEDGLFFLPDALNKSTLDALTTPFNGYLHVVPRLVAEATTLFPVSWAAAVLSTGAALIAAVLAVAVYRLSGAHLRSGAARLLVAAPLVIAPVGQGGLGRYGGSVVDNVATLQFVLVYALFWVVVTSAPALPSAAFGLLVGLSTPLTAVYLPVLALRLYARRDRATALLMTVLVVALGVQVAAGLTERGRVGPHGPEPLWLAGSYGGWLVPNGILGERWWHLAALRPALVIGAWLVIAAVLAAAALRLTAPNWPLAVAAAGSGAALCAGQLASFGAQADRYLYAPALLLIAALAALVQPAAGRAAALLPAVGLTVVLSVVCAANFRVHNFRAEARPWRGVVADAERACAKGGHRRVTVRTHARIPFWRTAIPCHKLS